MAAAKLCAFSVFLPILCLAQGPVIHSVLGAGDYHAGEFGIPAGSIFSVFGSGLPGSGIAPASLPLPDTLGGISVVLKETDSFAGRVIAICPLLYVSPRQINAILPSSVPPGIVYVSVRTGPTELRRETNRIKILVIPTRFAAFTIHMSGYGPAVLQNHVRAGVVVSSLTAPVRPGTVVVLWGTGLGSISQSDVLVYVGTQRIRPFYAGSAPGLPGVDQINFMLPSDFPDRGCFVPVQVRSGGHFGSVSTMSIGPPEICSTETGLSEAILRRLENGGRIRVSALEFESGAAVSDGAVTESAKAWEGDYNVSELSLLVQPGTSGATCGGPPAAMYGENASLPPAPEIRGEGCSWTFAPSGLFLEARGSSCRATGFRISQHGVSGALPGARNPGDLAALTAAKKASGEVTVGWRMTTSNENEQVETVLASESRSPTLVGTAVVYQSAMSCQTAAGNSELTIPAVETAWALQYTTALPVRVSAVRTRKLLRPSAASGAELVVISIRNAVTGEVSIRGPSSSLAPEQGTFHRVPTAAERARP